MIRLTRLRNPNPLYLNPDHIERLESHHETTVYLSNGNEYLVTESAEHIVELVIDQRARVLARAMHLDHTTGENETISVPIDTDAAWKPQPDETTGHSSGAAGEGG